MKKAELRELQELWARAVLLDDGGRPRPCWFGAHPESAKAVIDAALGFGPCGGERGPDACEGAHWVKRQSVEAVLWPMLQQLEHDGIWLPVSPTERQDLISLAEWDPRNGVPACEWHHRHFDSHLVNAAKRPFIVYRPFVPGHVEDFVAEKGLETPLEMKCPDLPADWADV